MKKISKTIICLAKYTLLPQSYPKKKRRDLVPYRVRRSSKKNYQGWQKSPFPQGFVKSSGIAKEDTNLTYYKRPKFNMTLKKGVGLGSGRDIA